MRDLIEAIHISGYPPFKDQGGEPSEGLMHWLLRWVVSSQGIEDQIATFEPFREEARHFLSASYRHLYRGMAITEEQVETLTAGHPITVPSHFMQSWTKSKLIAEDYAIPGDGGDYGVLVHKSFGIGSICVDVDNIIAIVGDYLLGIDAGREREVIVRTNGSLIVWPRDVLKVL